MADWLRRVLYPLVLPLIVGTVWLCGWVRQQDDLAMRNRWTLPALANDYVPPAPQGQIHIPGTIAQPVRTEFFAAADEGDAAEEP
jgi:hypothetical protein